MGYVKTPQEIATIQGLVQDLGYAGRAVNVQFRTDPDFIRSVLPPCFEPASEPLGLVNIGSSASEREGAVRTQFASSAIYVRAKFGEVQGWYHLTMILTGDMPITLGRELWGEAKKRGEVNLDDVGATMHGSVERNGVRLIDIETEFGADLGPRDKTNCLLDVKCFLDSTADDLEYDPIVIVTRSRSELSAFREGTAKLVLASSEEDPCGSIPVLSVEQATYDEHYVHVKRNERHRIDSREGYLPYLLGRSYDLLPHHS